MPDTVQTLRYNNAFMTIDVAEDNSATTLSQTGVNLVAGTKIAFRAATGIDDPTGTWLVNDERVDAGTVMAATIYNGWLSANNRAQSHLNAMSVNSTLAKASAAVATKLAALYNDTTTTSLSYTELLAIVQTAVTDNRVGLTAEAFLAKVLPAVTSDSSFQKSELRGLSDTASQYSSARLTDNSVLQQKYEVATATINTLQEAMSNILKAWMSNMQALAKNL